MPYWFFTSYASADHDPYMQRFFADLRDEVRTILGEPVDQLVFVDRRGIEMGEEWEPQLAEALRTSRICVSLCSQSYFNSTYCGKEYKVFLERHETIKEEIGQPQRLIFPVLWVPPCNHDLPELVKRFQFTHEDFPAVYAKEGLRGVTKHLVSPITITVSKPGCHSETLTLTTGPVKFVNQLNMELFEYYLYSSDHFEVRLSCVEREAYILNTITFNNRSGNDALIFVIGRTWRTLEIADGQEMVLKVAPGEYSILVRYGQAADHYIYSKGGPFGVEQTAGKHSAVTIALRKPIQNNLDAQREFDAAAQCTPGMFQDQCGPMERDSEKEKESEWEPIRRGEKFVAQGDLAEALLEFNKSLEVNSNSSLAHYHIAEVFQLQHNYQSAAFAYSEAISGDGNPGWIKVWSYIQLGKIFDITGQRVRALGEYRQAIETHDNTRGAIDEARRYLEAPYQREQKQ